MKELKKLLYMMFIITIIASCTSPVEEGNDDDDDNGGGSTPVKYTVTFESNGGNDVTVEEVEDGKLASEPSAPTKTGYTFDGWYIEDNFSTEWNFDTMTITEDTTIYAKWTGPNSYDVTFKSNGGTGDDYTQTITFGESSNLTANTFTKTNYTFDGWNTEADGNGDDYADEGSFTMNVEGITLYAKWGHDDLVNIEKSELVDVTGGTYTQTDSSSNSFEHTISSFSMGKYEVTYELWYTVRQWATSNGYSFANAGKEGHDGTAGAAPTAAKYEPVTSVSWRDVIVWCNAYSEMSCLTPVYTYSGSVIKDSRDSNATACDGAVADWSANGYRLPTEGEWQYAASNKGATPYNYASGATDDYNNATATGEVAWNESNSGSSTHDVGGKTANALGLYDMSGNVWEWCWDRYDDYPTSAKTDYRGGTNFYRVIRGGSVYYAGDYLQVGYRYNNTPDFTNSYFGFRVACSQ